MVKAAFWDTEQGAQVPSFLGAVQGTPTIRFFKPDSKSKSNKKVPIDYNGERKAKALISFAKQHEPNHIVSVKSLAAFDDFVQKADRNGLPKAVVFSKSASTSSMLKAMTVEYRRRLLIAEVKVSGATKVRRQHGPGIARPRRCRRYVCRCDLRAGQEDHAQSADVLLRQTCTQAAHPATKAGQLAEG